MIASASRAGLLAFGLWVTGDPLIISAQHWSPEINAGLIYGNNVSNSIRAEKTDSAGVLAVQASQLRILDRHWQGSLTLAARTEAWREFSGLNLSQVQTELGLRRKFGLGPYAPRLDFRLSGFHQIAETAEWSGNGFDASVSLQKRFTPQWFGSLTTDLKRFDARRAVYAHTSGSLTLAFDYDLTPDWRISTGLRYATGDQLSWCRESFPEFANKGPQWRDGIFGGDWFPYQSEGHRRGINLGLSRAWGSRSAITASYDASESRASKGHVYRNQIVSLSFSHAF